MPSFTPKGVKQTTKFALLCRKLQKGSNGKKIAVRHCFMLKIQFFCLMMNCSEFQREGLIDDIYIHSYIRGVYEKGIKKISKECVLIKL